MASLRIAEDDIPNLQGKIAVLTGGSSGIGLATAELLVSKGAKVYILDRNAPAHDFSETIHYVRGDVTSWEDQRAVFELAGRVDIAVACAAVSEVFDYFTDTFDEAGHLLHQDPLVMDVNFGGILKFIKLSMSFMKRAGTAGSIVVVASSTGYVPELAIPIYSASKSAIIGLVRALRPVVTSYDITINIVAPAATQTPLVPEAVIDGLRSAGIPVSQPDDVALAIVFSAVATQSKSVEHYGRDKDMEISGRWNGRCILTMGNTYTEIEDPLTSLRKAWLGEKNAQYTRLQQSFTDFREGGEKWNLV